MRVAFLLTVIFFFVSFCFANLVSEQEPNDDLFDPNNVQCGDTVECADLTGDNDIDHFRFWVAEGDSLHLTTYSCDGSLTNTFLVLYTDAGEVLATNNDGGPNEFSRIHYACDANGFYICRVMYGGNSTGSSYNLDIDCYEPVATDYDHCETAQIADFFPYYHEGSTIGMTNDAGTAAPDVFYKFNNPVTANVNLIVCTETFDARVQVFEYCLGGYLDDSNVGCFDGASLTVYPLPAGEYYVIVEGTSQFEMGFFSIEIGPNFPDCPVPQNLVISILANQPFLNWDDVPEASYYSIEAAATPNGPYEHLDISFTSFYSDPAGFASRRAYRVITVCPWGE